LRYKKSEEKSVEAKTLGIDHGGREVGRKTSFRRVKIKIKIRKIWVAITVEDLL
jgi:hypothetical protein